MRLIRPETDTRKGFRARQHPIAEEETRTVRGSKRTAILAAALGLLMLLAVVSVGAVSVTLCPYKINLNAVGQWEDVQAVIRLPMPAGFALTDFAVELWFDDVCVAEAYAMRYCYVDDNFLASFDRAELQVNPDVIAMAGSTVTATVEGWYAATNGEGDVIVVPFSGATPVEILAPGKKM